ncbi:MAG: Maf family protein [Bacteroidales bacterium]
MVNIKDMHIILGSSSPRRKELMEGLDLNITVDTGNQVEETYNQTIPLHQIPKSLAIMKSKGFHRTLLKNEVLITADTMVFAMNNDSIEIPLGKPATYTEAKNMLNLLSGKSHQVITGVCLKYINENNIKIYRSFSDTAKVKFNLLSDSEIDYYLKKYKPYDKAGAYGIQEWIGYIGVKKIQGSYFNIMGLPVNKVYHELLKLETLLKK